MSKRLQVLLPDTEMDEIQRAARIENVSVGEWVRRVIKDAQSHRPTKSADAKLKAIREAARFSFPVADIEQMVAETEQGYLE